MKPKPNIVDEKLKYKILLRADLENQCTLLIRELERGGLDIKPWPPIIAGLNVTVIPDLIHQIKITLKSLKQQS